MIKDKTCSNCGKAFKCGTTEPDNTCWCTALPNIVPMTDGAECLCPDCLKAKITAMQSTKTDTKIQVS